MFVRWSKPLAGGNNLDTIQNPPPYRFDLYRGNGFNFTNPQMIYSTTDAPSFSALVDTFYTDNGLLVSLFGLNLDIMNNLVLQIQANCQIFSNFAPSKPYLFHFPLALCSLNIQLCHRIVPL